MTGEQTARMRRFLLGDLAEQERVRVEQEFFADEAQFDLLLALEDELIFEYLAGRLTAAERWGFERRFAASLNAAGKQEFARALIAVAGGAAPAPGMRTIPVWGLAAAAAVLLAVGAGWWQARQIGELRREVAGLAERAPAIVAAPATVVAFALSPGMVRGDGASTKLRVPAGAVVRLQLDLRVNSRYAAYRVHVRREDGAEVWSGDVTPSGRMLVVEVAAGVMGMGAYRVAVQGKTDSGFEDDADYFFSVT